MDVRTTVRELEEMIARTRSATERETKLVGMLPASSLRRRKERVVRTMRDQLQRLENLPSSTMRYRASIQQKTRLRQNLGHVMSRNVMGNVPMISLTLGSL
jgi:hypothetical protein